MKIAYLCLSGIGDAIMQIPSIRAIREKYPEAEVHIITLSSSIEFIVKTEKYCDNIYTFNPLGPYLKEAFSIWKLGNQKHYDISVLGFPSYRKEYHIFQYLLGAKKRLFHRFESGGYFKEFHFLGTDSVIFDETKHNTINNLNLLKKIDIQSIEEYIYPSIIIPEDWKSKGQIYLEKLDISSNSRIIGIHPGGMNYPSALLKRWGYKNYAKLIKEIHRYGDYILVFSGPEDTTEINKLKTLLQGINHIYFIEENFETSIAILSHIDLLIANDNGFGHISASLGVKTLGLWGPTNPIWTAPNNPCYTVIRNSKNITWYRYELKRGIPKGMKSGMEDILLSHVLKEVYPEKIL